MELGGVIHLSEKLKENAAIGSKNYFLVFALMKDYYQTRLHSNHSNSSKGQPVIEI